MKYLGFVAKFLLSFGLLAVLLWRIDIVPLVDLLLRWTTFWGILLSVAALSIQGILAAYRQIEFLALFENQIGFVQSLRVWWSGLFVTQVAVTFIAGDFIRVVELIGEGVPRRTALRAIAFERLIGLAVLLLMVIAAVPYILALGPDAHLRLSLILLAVVSAAGVFAILGAGWLPSLFAKIPWSFVQHRFINITVDLVGVSRFTFVAPGRMLRIVGLTFVMHVLNLLGIVIIARSLGINASVNIAIIAIPVILSAMLPISFAGWGVREAAMVTGMGILHILPSLAVATSVAFGLSMMLTSAPGLVSLLFNDKRVREAIRFSQERRNF